MKTMKKRSCKIVMKKLIALHMPSDGKKKRAERAREAVGQKLDGISQWSVYKYAKGSRQPGRHLYMAIVRLYKEEMEAKDK